MEERKLLRVLIMKKISITFLFTFLFVIAGSVSALEEKNLQGNTSDSIVANGLERDRELHLVSPQHPNSEIPNSSSTSHIQATETQLNLEELVANEEIFNQANAFATQVLSNSKSWNEQANSLANILQKNIQEASKQLQDPHLIEQGHFSPRPSRTETVNILDSISELMSKRNLDVTPEAILKPRTRSIDSSTPNIAIFVSFSMPKQSLQTIIREARLARVPVYLRGFKNGSLTETARHAATIISNSRKNTDNQDVLNGLLIDPRAFKIFQIEQVPTFVAFQGSLADCDTLKCSVVMPEHDRVAGNISLRSALELLSKSGTPAAEHAKVATTRLEGEY